MPGDRFGLRQPAPYLDDVSDGALAKRPNDLGVLSKRDLCRRLLYDEMFFATASVARAAAAIWSGSSTPAMTRSMIALANS
jgi:hypothetical protein